MGVMLRGCFMLFSLLACHGKVAASSGVDCTTSVADVAFLVDTSGSICGDLDVSTCTNWKLIMDFIIHIMDHLAIGETNTRISLTLFGSIDKTRVVFYLDTSYDKSAIKNVISNLGYEPNQESYSGSGINLVMSHVFVPARGDRSTARNILIILTDGKSTRGGVSAISAANAAKAAGVKVLVIGVTSDVDLEEIKGLSSSPQLEHKTFWLASQFTFLGPAVSNEVVSVTCSFACPVSTYGESCRLSCSANCDDSLGCHKDSGVCFACKAGFSGERCANEGAGDGGLELNIVIVVAIIGVLLFLSFLALLVYKILRARTPANNRSTSEVIEESYFRRFKERFSRK